MQNAWVVTDIESAARSWSRTLGIGPFFIGHYDKAVFEGLRYRGAPGELTMRTAIAYSGDIQIELVQPLGALPSAYRDMFPAGRTGFHHVCFWSTDLDGDIDHYVRQGAVLANRGRMRGGPEFAYVDTRRQLGCMVELLEMQPGIQSLFARWQERCKTWDGRDPVIWL